NNFIKRREEGWGCLFHRLLSPSGLSLRAAIPYFSLRSSGEPAKRASEQPGSRGRTEWLRSFRYPPRVRTLNLFCIPWSACSPNASAHFPISTRTPYTTSASRCAVAAPSPPFLKKSILIPFGLSCARQVASSFAHLA